MNDFGWKEITEEIFYTQKDFTEVEQSHVAFLKNRAIENKRKRSRLCAHNDTQDITQEMIIVLCQGTYGQPHKHIGKSESFHIIEGSANLIFFDEEGCMTDVVELGDYSSGKKFYYRIAGSLYHSVVVTSDIFVFHETTKGPYIASHRTDTVFAAWAPKDGDQDVKGYMQKLADFANTKGQSVSVMESS